MAVKAKAHILPWVDNILSRMIFFFRYSSWVRPAPARAAPCPSPSPTSPVPLRGGTPRLTEALAVSRPPRAPLPGSWPLPPDRTRP